MSRFAANLIKRRADNDWTQQDLADRSGVSRATIALYECDRRTPKYKSIAKLASAIGCSVKELYPEYDQLDSVTDRDKFTLLQEQVTRLAEAIDKSRDYNYVSGDLVAEDDVSYGVSEEARYIAAQWDRLSPAIRRQILTEIVKNRYEGMDDATNRRQPDPPSTNPGKK